eukprot:TRINITY_DN2661_c0_g1_i1.p1 TRINITY_DN2661_c0_g1~~TRINITY_DN2661_c0_g1_i1.p1  ORF type:complete len:1060 (+),score=197.28 TRINITY_DN2661_c0_g1_i1:52-3231(+)
MQKDSLVQRISDLGITEARYEPDQDQLLFTSSHLIAHPHQISPIDDGPIYSFIPNDTPTEAEIIVATSLNDFHWKSGWTFSLNQASERSLSLLLSSLYVLQKRLKSSERNDLVATAFTAKLNSPACGLLLRLLSGESLQVQERRLLGWSFHKLCRSLGTSLDQSNVVLAALMRSEPHSKIQVEEQSLLCTKSGEPLVDPVIVDGALCNRDKTSAPKTSVVEVPKLARLCKYLKKVPTVTRFWKVASDSDDPPEDNTKAQELDLMAMSKTLRTSCAMMHPLPPLSLKSAPKYCLTVNEAKQYCCFVGRGKDVTRSANLFCPIDGQESEVDPQELAKKLSIDEIYSDFAEGDRPTEEVVIVCFDKSLSMNEDAFSINREPLPLVEMTSEKISQKIVTHRVFPLAEPMILGALASLQSLKVLKELVHMATPLARNPNLKEILKEIKTTLDYSQNDLRVVICPITGAPVVDPVITCDGFTYERSAIEKWLLTSDTSPLTGLRLESKKLIPNVAIRGGSYSQSQALKVKISLLNEIYETEMPVTSKTRVKDVIDFVKEMHSDPSLKWRAFCGTTMLREEAAVIGVPKVLVRGRKLVPVQFEIRRNEFQTVAIENESTGLEILWEFYEFAYFRNNKPSKTQLWRDLKEIQDGYRSGSKIKLDQQVYSVTPSTTFHVYPKTRHGTMGKKPEVLSKLTLSKQLFHCFTDRTDAYNYAHKIGLIEFASDVTVVCRPTSTLDLFHDSLENISASGNTLMYDSVIEASKCFSNMELPKSTKLRILLLTDGVDSGSKNSLEKAIEKLKSDKIVLDAICMKVENGQLRRLSYMTGGLCFCPKSLSDAMDVIQLETLLRLSVRDYKVPVHNQVTSYRASNASFDTASGPNRPRLKEEATKNKFYAEVNNITPTKNTNARIMKELTQVMKEKHPAYEVFFSENLRSWKVLMSGPVDDEAENSPYSGGSFILSVIFGDNYPNEPPEVRFITPILHCNVNSYGRICHSVLDRNWTLETSMNTVLQCIYGLLLTPEPDDPLDVYLAQMYHTNRLEYTDKIRDHVVKHGKATAREILK